MPTRARRTDAVDNRERILAATRAMLAKSDEGPESLNLRLVAHNAGVGQGTLYRHFPTRQDLVTEAYRDEMTALVDAVPALLQAHQPLEALALWLDRVVEHARVKKGVVAAIETSTWQELHAAEHPRLDQALQTLLDEGNRTGAIRDDVDAADVVLLLGTLTRIPAHEWNRRARLTAAIIVDGLRTPHR